MPGAVLMGLTLEYTVPVRRIRALVLALTLVGIHFVFEAPCVFAQSPPAPTLASVAVDGNFVVLRWTLLPDYRLSIASRPGARPG